MSNTKFIEVYISFLGDLPLIFLLEAYRVLSSISSIDLTEKVDFLQCMFVRMVHDECVQLRDILMKASQVSQSTIFVEKTGN